MQDRTARTSSNNPRHRSDSPKVPAGSNSRHPRRARYKEIADTLRADIRNDVYPIGSSLPSEANLASNFGVAAGTIRQALKELLAEGTLSSRRGARKVVIRTPARFPETSKFRSFAQWVYSQGRTPGGHVIRQQWLAALDADAKHLRTTIGSPILEVLRVRTIDDRPIMMERTRYPEWVGTKVEAMSPQCSSVTNELRSRHGIHFVAADNIFSTDLASADDVEHLPIHVGDPVLVHRRISRDGHGNPLEMGEDHYMAHALAIAVPTSGFHNSLSWTSEDNFPWP